MTTQRSSYRRSLAEGEVELLRQQHHVDAGVGEDRVVEPGEGLHPQGGVRGALGDQAGEVAAEDVRRRRRERDRDRACVAGRVETGEADHESGLVERPAQRTHELGAVRGERHAAALAHEQVVVDEAADAGQGMAHCRLRQPDPRCRTCHRTLLQQREQRGQQVEVDGCQPVEVGRPGLPLLHHGPHSSPQTVAASQSRRSRGTGIR